MSSGFAPINLGALSCKTSESTPSPIGWERAGVRVHGAGQVNSQPHGHSLALPALRNLSSVRYLALFAATLLTLLLPMRTAQAQSATLDFDTGTPTLSMYGGLPIDQAASGVTAHFKAVTGGFSVQTASSMGGLRLSMFSGRFLAPVNHTGSSLEIQFSEWVTNVSFTFATIQVQPIELETPIRLTAYTNSAATPPVGVTNVAGVYGGPTGTDSWPMGTLTFSSSTPFNLVRITVPTIVPTPPTGQATDYCLDNLTVQRAGGPACTITATASPSGGGLITGSGDYSAGLTATLTASANLGYLFLNWTESGAVVSSSPSFSFTATTNRTLVANFQATYSITTSSSPSAGGATSGGGTYPAGSNVTVVATANAGYVFVSWTQGGAAVTNTASYTFAASANRSLVANFVRVYTITTSASPSAGGSTSGDGNYPAGSNVTVLATANPGYAFVNWTQTGVPLTSSASYTFVMGSAAKTLVANFIAVYAITTSASPIEGGSTSGGGSYTNGASVTLLATNHPGFAFINWTENGLAVTNSVCCTLVVGTTNRALVANLSPIMQMARSASQTLVLSWPGPLPEYKLQHTATVGPVNWVDATNEVAVVGDHSQAIVSPPLGTCFFRLLHR